MREIIFINLFQLNVASLKEKKKFKLLHSVFDMYIFLSIYFS